MPSYWKEKQKHWIEKETRKEIRCILKSQSNSSVFEDRRYMTAGDLELELKVFTDEIEFQRYATKRLMALGYRISTKINMRGLILQPIPDIMAWKDDRLYIIECKLHLSLRSLQSAIGQVLTQRFCNMNKDDKCKAIIMYPKRQKSICDSDIRLLLMSLDIEIMFI